MYCLCHTYNRISHHAYHNGCGHLPLRQEAVREGGLFSTSDLCMLFRFYRKYGKNTRCFLSDESSYHRHEAFAGIVLSQVISNVPAAILLSGFTGNYSALLYGVNIGGLGTLIASLASIISYRGYCTAPNARKGKYILVFTIYNLIFLAVLSGTAFLLL